MIIKEKIVIGKLTGLGQWFNENLATPYYLDKIKVK